MYYYQFLKYVSNERKEKILRFNRFENSLRSLLGSMLIRYSIVRRLGVKNKDIEIYTDEYGKPFINVDNVYFNVSHSNEYVICAIGRNQVGIDIEFIKERDYDIVKYYFSEKEYSLFKKVKKEKQLNYLYKMWTYKESYIKILGKGFRIKLNSFIIDMIDNNNAKILGNNKYSLKQLNVDTKYSAAICSENEYINGINYIDINDLNIYIRNNF
jgi:4'-phosphopantetheinyl transferase